MPDDDDDGVKLDIGFVLSVFGVLLAIIAIEGLVLIWQVADICGDYETWGECIYAD